MGGNGLFGPRRTRGGDAATEWIDLAQVTATALSNLLVSIGKEACARVCLVITDLTTAYLKGSAQIAQLLSDFEKETHRVAMSLNNTDNSFIEIPPVKSRPKNLK